MLLITCASGGSFICNNIAFYHILCFKICRISNLRFNINGIELKVHHLKVWKQKTKWHRINKYMLHFTGPIATLIQ